MDKVSDRILAFDPGKATGIAFVEKGSYRMGINVSPEMFQKESFLTGLISVVHPTLIVIETPPEAAKFYVTPHLDLFSHLKRWFQNAGFPVKTVKPGQWKRMIDRSKIESSHIRDATDMARFVYKEMSNGQG